MSAVDALAALGMAGLLAAVFGFWRYGTLLNPLTFTAFINTGITTFLSGVFAYQLLPLGKYTDRDLVGTAWISIAALIATTIPYFSRGRYPSIAFGRLMRAFGLQSRGLVEQFSVVKFAFLVLAAVFAFAALAIAGGGGVLWLTDTRVAYLLYRTGAGQFWILTSWLLFTALAYYLWAKRPAGPELILIAAPFAVAAYYTGSKANILTVVVVGVVYYHFMVRSVRTALLLVGGIAGICSFVGLLYFQHSFSDLAGVVSYFEHFQISAQFIGRFDEFGYQYGKAWLSSLWFYVPRALYPGKPLEYGPVLIQKTLFPGAYEAGYAPGFLTWSLSYLDFGLVGVFVSGWWTGILQRAAYEHFLEHKGSLFAFIFMMQVSLWGVFQFASIEATLIWCILQSLILRLVLVHRHRNASDRGLHAAYDG